MFTHKKVVNTYIVYEMNLWPFTVGKDFMIENSIFRAVKLTTNNDHLENIDILAKVMDFIHVEVSYYQMVVNLATFGAILCILIIKKKS